MQNELLHRLGKAFRRRSTNAARRRILAHQIGEALFDGKVAPPQREADATLEESQQSSLIVEPGIDQHKGKQIEKSDSMAIGSQTLFASVPSSGESIIAFLKRHKKIEVLALVLILNGVAGIAFWILPSSSTRVLRSGSERFFMAAVMWRK